MAMTQGELIPQVFNHPEFGDVRIVDNNGDPWFVGKDVAEKLGYTNPLKAIRDHIDAEDKRSERIVHPLGGAQETIIINEGGLYSLTVRSNMPNAKKFTRWLTHDVAISIRKHGVYATADFLSKSIADPAWAIGLLTELKAKQDETALLKVQLAEAKPKVDYCDVILQCADLITTSAIAKDYGYSAKAFNKLLHKLGIQFKQGDLWLLYQKYATRGWTQTKTHKYMGGDEQIHCKVHTYWTQKGRLELYHLLKRNGILPLIEQAD